MITEGNFEDYYIRGYKNTLSFLKREKNKGIL
jgi:hypothetical protein